eukprot:scaffold2923_cov313-Pinguiococcus_pyrenoidosus.AAC.24
MPRPRTNASYSSKVGSVRTKPDTREISDPGGARDRRSTTFSERYALAFCMLCEGPFTSGVKVGLLLLLGSSRPTPSFREERCLHLITSPSK